jgi:hypothetical protein
MANLDHVAYDAPPEDADRLRMLGKGDLAVVPMVVDDRARRAFPKFESYQTALSSL